MHDIKNINDHFQYIEKFHWGLISVDNFDWWDVDKTFLLYVLKYFFCAVMLKSEVNIILSWSEVVSPCQEKDVEHLDNTTQFE